MKKNFWKVYSWCLLVTVVFVSAFITIEQGPRFIGSDYFEDENFQNRYDDFLRQLGPIMLTELDAEKLKGNITVSQEQIEEYRYRDGSLSEQIDRIQSQYNQRIADAEASDDEMIKNVYIKERDTKIVDIQKKFEDDSYVAGKIKAEKEKEIDIYITDIKNSKASFQSNYGDYAYKLTNVETGKTYTQGDVSEKAAFSKTYSEGTKYLEVPSSMDAYSKEVQEIISETSSSTFYGQIILPKTAVADLMDYKAFYKHKTLTFITMAIGIISLLVVVFLFKFQKSWFQESSLRKRYEALPFDLQLLLVLFTFMVTNVFVNSLTNYMYYYSYANSQRVFISDLFNLGITTFLVWLLISKCVWLLDDMKRDPDVIGKLKRGFIANRIDSFTSIFSKTSVGIQVLVTLAIVFFWGVGTVLTIGYGNSSALPLLYIISSIFIGIPAVILMLSKTGYLNKILIATEKVANGVSHEPIPERGRSVLSQHAKHVNKLRTGIRTSLTEQAKSERLKTELITNVSHDLRTPLTSIITYTDLLKNQDLSEEERKEYVDILERKSNILKTLIEDLFEVSKMASGNLELQKQKVDLTQLAQQVIGEHQEQIEQSGLEFRVTTPDKPVIANVDGQKMWRVLDNLITNAMKYSLDNTRVYVTLKQENGLAEFIIKNVTKYELGENIDELVERFKRADTSRHTEGSGLGLAIVQSIVDLHGGAMRVELDGDLFKVTVQIEAL
ncbi:sensor histidine kinase [Bacillus solimangrovi]|uniref:histidine kinase n=1 Tax=Bacillus solimangrovi TaxID=1305675 RepID=A0A1E5LB87_9BACI|nr:HAMP domain-containing sensor histidine kinase [Bacillus solimangrovi]OEH91351.1 hypothetical protein BFG57_05655 [Bacillus solimangrovi]